MKKPTLLSLGIGAIVIAFVGPAVAGGITGQGTTAWGPFGQMQAGHMSYQHMGGFDSETYGSDQIAPTIDNATEIVVTLGDFTISPTEVVVVEGDSMNITVVNSGSAPHDFSVPGLGIRIFVAPGETKTTGVSGQSAGTYDTLCSIPGHASLGMVGSLIVQREA